MINILSKYNEKYKMKAIFSKNTYVVLNDLNSVIKFIEHLYNSKEFMELIYGKKVHEELFTSNFLYLKNTFKLAYILGYKDKRFLLKISTEKDEVYINVTNLDNVNPKYTIIGEHSSLKFSKEEMSNLKVYDPTSEEFYTMKRGIFKWRREKRKK